MSKHILGIKMDKEVTKEEFKKLYFKYATGSSGWTKEYWDKFFEKEKGKKYFFTKPKSPKANRMHIFTDKNSHRIFFLTEEAEESLYGNQSTDDE